MTYQEYLDRFREAQFQNRLDFTENPWSEEIFRWFYTPLEITNFPNNMEKLTIKEMYLRLKRLIEKGNADNKVEQLAELEKIYQELAEKYNLD